jgi:hypothetical protein
LIHNLIAADRVAMDAIAGARRVEPTPVIERRRHLQARDRRVCVGGRVGVNRMNLSTPLTGDGCEG